MYLENVLILYFFLFSYFAAEVIRQCNRFDARRSTSIQNNAACSCVAQGLLFLGEGLQFVTTSINMLLRCRFGILKILLNLLPP